MEGKYSNPNDFWYYNRKSYSKSPKDLKGCFMSLIGIILIVIFSLLLSSCRSIKYVPVETVKTEYVTKKDTFIQRDSVHVKDSIMVLMRGDTVFTDRWHTIYKDRIVDRVKVDSFIRTDSVQIPYPVEKSLTKWQKLKMDAGGFCFVVCCSLLLVICWLLKRNVVR